MMYSRYGGNCPRIELHYLHFIYATGVNSYYFISSYILLIWIKRKIILLYIHLSYYSNNKLPGSQGKGKKDKVMKKIEKNCKKIVKATNKVAKKHPVAAVTTGAVTGALAVTGASFLVEKAVGKVVFAIRSKRSEKKDKK